MKELNEEIIQHLRHIPEELREAEILLGKANQSIVEAKEAVSDAELDAEINATIDGKNAEERKRQLKEALANYPPVNTAKKNLNSLEMEVIELESNVKSIGRMFRANLALAELQAARMNLLAKYQKEN